LSVDNQAGYTPSAIRDSIHNILQTTATHDHIVNFHERDIPPKNRDPVTFQTLLHNLACERNRLNNDFSLMVEHRDGHDSNPDLQRAYEQDYIQRDQQYNRINRKMYQVYAASAYIIHDNNFLSYCKPALRNLLPINTACRLASLRQKTEDLTPELPPYQKIESPSTTQTKPEFANPRPTYSDVVREKLKPRSEWTKAQPPLMSDSEADNAWQFGNERLFGAKLTTTIAIEQEIATLQSQLARQRKIDTMQASSEPCPQLTSNAPSLETEQDNTTRRQAFYNAAERFSARCDQNEHEGLRMAKTIKRSHEDEQLWHSLIDKSPGTTHKNPKCKLPTRSQPSCTKPTPSAIIDISLVSYINLHIYVMLSELSLSSLFETIMTRIQHKIFYYC
jgi:hypothetical protein